MVEVNGAYKHGRYEKTWLNSLQDCQSARQMNTTHYTDPHNTNMDQKDEDHKEEHEQEEDKYKKKGEEKYGEKGDEKNDNSLQNEKKWTRSYNRIL